jgi:hypothetical protein
MDAFTPGSAPGEAKLRYLDADFEVVKPGRFVVCAVTGRKIALEDLRYWSVESQEAYFDAEAALKRWKQQTGTP